MPDAAHYDGGELDTGFGGRFSGNIFAEDGESNIGESSNGHTTAEGNHSNNGSIGPEREVRDNDSPGS